jgi:hypothetical protein
MLGTSTHLLNGQAMDTIIVVADAPQDQQQADSSDAATTTTIILSSNEFNVSFAGDGVVRVHLDGAYIEGLDLVSSRGKEECQFQHRHGPPSKKAPPQALKRLYAKITPKKSMDGVTPRHKYDLPNKKRSYQQHADQKQSLKDGRCHAYTVCYHLVNPFNNAVLGTAEAKLYIFQSTDRIIICDIDGTITKSNVRGIWDTIVTDSYQHVHPGVCRFLHEVCDPAPLKEDDADLRRMVAARRRSPKDDFVPTLRVVYLTARPLSLASTTRRFLQTFHQLSLSRDQEELFGPPLSATRKFLQKLQRISEDKDEHEELHDLPPGPLLCNLHDMRSILVSELVLRDVHHHKVELLKKQLLLPFQEAKLGRSVAFPNGGNQHIMTSCPLVLGIGNSLTDTMAYNMSGVPLPCIYQINSKGFIVCFDTLAKQEDEQSVIYRCSIRQKDPFAIFEGSTFYGYEDPKLLEHCQNQLKVGIEQQRFC